MTTNADTTYDFPRWEWKNPMPNNNVSNDLVACKHNKPSAHTIVDAYCVAGDNGSIAWSDDDGNTWQTDYTNETEDLNSLVAIEISETPPDYRTIAVGDNGTIIQYNANLNSWTDRSIVGDTHLYEKIYSLDANNLLAISGSHGALSHDGGTTWSTTNIGYGIDEFANLNGQRALAITSDERVIWTNDAGATWTGTENQILKNAKTLTSLDEDRALVSFEMSDGNYNFKIFTYNAENVLHWTGEDPDQYLTLSGTYGSDLRAMANFDSTTVITGDSDDTYILEIGTDTVAYHGVDPDELHLDGLSNVKIISSYYAIGSYASQFYVINYSNGAWHSESKTVDLGDQISFLAPIDTENIAVLSTNYGNVYSTTNGGTSWTKVTDRQDYGDPDLNDSIISVHSFSPDDTSHLAAIVEQSTPPANYLYVSGNNGATWTKSQAYNIYNGYEFLNDNQSIVDSDSYGGINASHDYGHTWNFISNNVQSDNYDEDLCPIETHDHDCFGMGSFHAFGENSSIAIASYGGKLMILSYANDTWNLSEDTNNPAGSYSIKDAISLDNNNAIAVGDHGSVIYSTDNGNTWNNLVSGTTETLVNIKKIDANNAIAVGDNGAIVKINNSGSWSAANKSIITERNLNQVEALDDSHLIADEYKELNSPYFCYNSTFNEIAYSADSGETWSKKITDLTASDCVSKTATLTTNDTISYLAVTHSGKLLTVKVDRSNGNFTSSVNATFLGIYFKDIIGYDTNSAMAVGASGKVIVTTDGGSNWSQITSGTTLTLSSIIAFDPNHLLTVGAGVSLYLNYNNEAWNVSSRPTNTINYLLDLYKLDTDDPDQFEAIAVGTNWSILHFYTPANASAATFDIELGGQKFTDGSGVSGSVDQATAGVNYPATIYAVDSTHIWDKSTSYQAIFTTTDPFDTNPSPLTLNGDGSCDGTSLDPCGNGVVNFNFHTATINNQGQRIRDPFTVTVIDPNSFLTSKTSASIDVLPGVVSMPSLSSSASQTQLRAGVASAPMTITLKDQFGNVTTSGSDTTVSLSSSGSGRFSTSATGPWTETLNITIPTGSSTTTFYYLNYTLGSSTITASASGLSNSTYAFNIIPASIDTTILSGTRVTLNPTTQTVGGSVNVAVTLAGTGKANRAITLYSSKSGDVITQPAATDGNGYTTGILRSTISDVSTISAKVSDPEGDIWLEESPSANFLPGPVDSLGLTSNLKKSSLDDKLHTSAGSPFNIISSLYDQYRNLATNTIDTIALTSTDLNYYIPLAHKMTSTDAGIYQFSGVALKTAGGQTITVTDTDVNKSSDLDIVVDRLSPSKTASAFTTDKNKLILGQDKANLTVKITDEYGNGIPGEEVELKYSTDLGTINTPKKTTNAEGSATFEYTPTKEGKDTLYARDVTQSFTLTQTIDLENVPDTLLNQLQNNPTAKKIAEISKTIAAITGIAGLIPLLANVIGAAPGALHAINYGLSLFFEAIGIKKRRKSWGRVYDSTTGRGIDLALVRLFDQRSAKLVATIVTDIQGRYNFRLEPGTYAVSVSKPEYLFPTQIFAKYGISKINKADSRFNTHYVGQPITIGEKDSHLNIDIPIDPIKKKPNAWIRAKIIASDLFDILSYGLSSIFLTLLIIGTALSVFTAIILPDNRNTILACIYVIITGIYLLSKYIRRTYFGIIFNIATGKPIEGAVVSVFDKEYGTLKETRITDRYGRFSIYAQKGSYYLKVQKEGLAMDDGKIHGKKALYFGKKVYHNQTINLSRPDYIAVSVGMEKES